MPDGTRYDDDFFLWTQEQGNRLRGAQAAGSNVALDLENIAEEIESLGRSERRELAHRLDTILTHLIKLFGSPAERPRAGWINTVRRERQAVQDLLEDSPSLRGAVAGLVAARMEFARESAAVALSENEEELDLSSDQEAEVIAGVLDAGFIPAAVCR